MMDGVLVGGPEGAAASQEETKVLFAKLEAEWGWGAHVTKYLTEELGCATTHDLIHAFRTDQDWREFYDADIRKADGAKVPRAVRGRVSQLHERLLKSQKEAAVIRDKGEEAVEFEKPLGTEVLAKMRRTFWTRHKIRIHITNMPGDLLLSRLSKEIDKRFLHVTDLMKIKGVVWERQSESKKEKIGDNLYTEIRPEGQDERRAETVWNYLNVMEMYMLAMSIVGAEPVKQLPETPESITSDPADYVVFPYQYALDCLGRARAFVQATLKRHTATQAYEILRELDRAERQK